jgi:cytosine/adenosine deaminase-related metal-dependent hydrolase
VDPSAGAIAVGAPADLAVFAVEAWDPDAAPDVPVPDLTSDRDLPRCLATIIDGRVAFADTQLHQVAVGQDWLASTRPDRPWPQRSRGAAWPGQGPLGPFGRP